jgi:hypothetical protein
LGAQELRKSVIETFHFLWMVRGLPNSTAIVSKSSSFKHIEAAARLTGKQSETTFRGIPRSRML